MSQAIKYICINLNMGYSNETFKFIIVMKILGVQIDNNNLIITYQEYVCIHRGSSVCFAMVADTGLRTTGTLYFHFTLSF